MAFDFLEKRKEDAMRAVVDQLGVDENHSRETNWGTEGQGYHRSGKNHRPIEVTSHLFQLGTPAFPGYLSMGEQGMIIEGGTGPTFPIMVDQVRSLGIDPERIKYILLTHTHPDHIGAVPHFQRAWPHIKLLTSPTGAKILAKRELFKQFQLIDLGIAQLMKAKAEINALPEPIKEYTFKVDSVVQEGDSIDLGAGIVWHIYDTPGHSPCHIALFEEKEKTLVLGDVTGFYVPGKGVFWPNYFESLEKYCSSIRKLAPLPAKRAALSHNGVVEGDVRQHLEKAMEATKQYHQEIIERLRQGEVSEKIAMEKARFVDSLTDIQPFRVIYDLCEVMVKNSLANGEEDHFIM
jgi:glyoxylase-like metal-dependent hydrolase (beta-lactamase superfamily II)